MTKAKARLLASELVERDCSVEVRQVGDNDYTVMAVSKNGATTAQVDGVVTAVGGIAATVRAVEFI